MIENIYKMQGKVVQYPGMGAWHFISVPKKQSDRIKSVFGAMKRGFGSLRVIATVGKSKWKTSIFPDNNAEVYLLPLKAEVRKKEKVKDGDVVSITLEILL